MIEAPNPYQNREVVVCLNFNKFERSWFLVFGFSLMVCSSGERRCVAPCLRGAAERGVQPQRRAAMCCALLTRRGRARRPAPAIRAGPQFFLPWTQSGL